MSESSDTSVFSGMGLRFFFFFFFFFLVFPIKMWEKRELGFFDCLILDYFLCYLGPERTVMAELYCESPKCGL